MDTQTAPKTKYVLYARKSTESEERQILSIDSQVKEMLAIAERDQLDIVDIRRESHSAKDSGQRPVYREIIEDIRKQRFNGILTWAPDRLSRNAGDLGSIVDLMDQGLLSEIRTYGQQFRNSPNEKFLLMILCSQAKLENDNKSINVKRGMKTRCEMGLWPGRAPTGYLSEKRIDKKCEVYVDPERGPIIKKIFEKVAYEKWAGRKVLHWLKFELNFRTECGKKHLTLGNIYTLLENHFYYGRFEYPKKSGNWYTGRHEPLIDKELFDLVQAQVKSQILRTSEPKEFAFTKLMVCGLCGSGVSAEEKFKKLKDGRVNRHIYYGCNRSRNQSCQREYISEQDLIDQFLSLIDTVKLAEAPVKQKIKIEVERIKRFNSLILDSQEKIEIKDIDIRNYAKYILKSGTNSEKKELLGCLTSKISLIHKKVSAD